MNLHTGARIGFADPRHDDGPRSSFLDPYLSIRPGTPFHRIADDMRLSIDRRLAPDLARAPRADAVERRRQVIENILANVALMVLAPGYQAGDVLALSTAKTKPTRYDRTDLGKHLWGEQARALAEQGELVVHPYVFKERLTTLEPSGRFLSQLETSAAELADIGRTQGAETIWLSARTAAEGRYGGPPPKELIDYRDDEDSRRFRGEMLRINRFLNTIRLTFDGRPQGPVALRRTFLLRHRADPVAFNLNGRLAGAWWLQLPARDRHRIRLDGEPLADLDFKGMFVQLAYRSHDLALREDFDPYALPGLEQHREGAKLAMLSLLGRHRRMRALSPELKRALPTGWNAARLVATASDFHDDIATLFGKDLAVQLMFQESQILVAVLLRLIDRGIPALPMHDGIMVRQSTKGQAFQAMREVSAQWLGGSSPLPVTEKPIQG